MTIGTNEVFRTRAMKGVTLDNEEGDTLVGNPNFVQAAHGFTVGTVVRRSSATAHVKAKADSEASIGVGLAVVISVPDANSFSILRTNNNHTVKIVGVGAGRPFGTRLYLSDDTAGAMTEEANVDLGRRVYLGYVLDTDHMNWEPGWTRW
jgi:hypothetical protein